jgi:hypothetical protein
VREACEGFRRRVLLMTAGMHVGAPPLLPPGAPTVALPVAEYPEYPESAPFGLRALEGEPATAAPNSVGEEGTIGTVGSGTGFQPHVAGRGERGEAIRERLPGMAGWLVAEPAEHWGSRWTIPRYSQLFRPCRPSDGAIWCEMRGTMVVWRGVHGARWWCVGGHVCGKMAPRWDIAAA